MRAVVLSAYGGPEKLQLGEANRPEVGHGRMVVRVRACGVCGHDILARQGRLNTPLPQILGHEIAGDVVEVGPGVDAFAPGDRVALNQRISCGVCRSCRRGAANLCVSGLGFYGENLPGGYAEYVLATPGNAVALPREIDYVTGAILSCGIGTGLHAVIRARVRVGETVVVTGAGGGVGIHAVASARLLGARVIGITGSPDKVQAIRSAGADEVVVVPDGDFVPRVRQLTGGDGADAVIECVGTPMLSFSIRAVAHGGRIAIVGNVRPELLQANPGLMILKELEFIGSAHATPEELRTTVELVRLGRISPCVAAALPLEEAARAHELLENRRALGRVVLLVS